MPDQVKSPPQTREGLRALIEQVKKNKLRDLTCGIEGLTVRYTVCGEWPDWLDSGLYDAQGTIYVSDTLVRKDRWLADLTAFHEQTELNHQAAGRSHAYAHRRALLLELLAAKRHFGQPGQLRGFVRWRLEGYPEWKVQDKQGVEDRLYDLLQERPLRGEILKVITQARL